MTTTQAGHDVGGSTAADPEPATLVERVNGLVIITFNRPKRMNALNGDNWAVLGDTLSEVMRNPADRALILTGSQGNFSSGADLSGGLQSDAAGNGASQPPRQSTLNSMRDAHEIVHLLYRLPKPTIAAVDGYAIGVALGLALACDLIIASDRARFSEVFVKRGLALDGGSSWSLPRQIGIRRAKWMTMLGEPVNAAEALSWGLVNQVVSPEELMPTARALGERLASGPTTALSLIKRMLDANGSLTFEEALEDEARAQHIAFTTGDMQEGMLAFQERRAPHFTGD